MYYLCARYRVETATDVTAQAKYQGRSNGGIGRHEGLKILWHLNAVRVQVPLRVLDDANSLYWPLAFFVFPGEQGLCIEQLDVEDVSFAGDSFRKCLFYVKNSKKATFY